MKRPVKSLSRETRLQHLAAPSAPGGEPITAPIYQTSTYELPDPSIGAEVASGYHPQRYYTRYGSPNVATAEALVADLEGAEAALATGSGMAAIAGAVLAQVRAGDHVIAQNTHYTATLSLLDDWLPRNGVSVTKVDQADPRAFQQAVTGKTRLVYLETPTNPTMVLTDLAAVASIAAKAGARSVIDNTFASSFNQRPHDFGIDLVVHSATKYLNGHSDVTAGVVTGRADLVAPVWEYARVHGPVLHPMEAWLLVRGLRTYALRMTRHNESAMTIAKALSTHESIAAVHYPGLPSHPQHDLAIRQMTGGFGGMLSFEIKGDTASDCFARAQAVLEGVALCKSAVSLGSTETLITHPASLIFAHQSIEELESAGIPPGLLRLSAGLEDPNDLIEDLVQAIDGSCG